MGVEEEKTMSIASPEHARVQRQGEYLYENINL